MKLVPVFILMAAVSWSQADSSAQTKHVFGARFSGYLLSTTEDSPVGASKTFEFRVEPYYMYSVNRFLDVGVLGEYHTGGSTLANVSVPEDLYGIGLISRFNYPVFRDYEQWKNRFELFSEVSVSTTNFYLSTENTFAVNPSISFDYMLLRLRLLGVSLRIYKELHMDLSVFVYKFQPGRWGTLGNFGLYYKL